ncbi:MAG: hypothetical protein H7X94_09030, partial [Vallitaleaceae bacterium]|nr:hypothetical protein [Vallitaleaceae bacterium]
YEDTIEMEKVINDAYIYFSIIVNALLPIFIYVTYLIKSFILSKMKLKSST